MKFMDLPLYDPDFVKLVLRFAHNVLFLTIIVRYALLPNVRDREFVFTAVMLNIVVFFICFTMKKLDIGLGMALGLFAIFGVLRYRTDAIRTKEMTYLFIVIGIAVINAITNNKTSYVELLAVNVIITSVVILKERYLSRIAEAKKSKKNGLKSPQSQITIDYDNLGLLSHDQRPALVDDLRRRTGIEASHIEVQNIDLKNSSARLVIWFC